MGELRTETAQARLLALFSERKWVGRHLLRVWGDVLATIDAPEVLPLVTDFLNDRLSSGPPSRGNASKLWAVAFDRMGDEARGKRVRDVLADPSLGPSSLLRAELLNAIGGDLPGDAIERIAQELGSPNMATQAFKALVRLDNPEGHALAVAHLARNGHQAINVAPSLGPRLTVKSARALGEAAETDPRVTASYLGAVSTASASVLRSEADRFRTHVLVVLHQAESAVPYARVRAAQALLRAAGAVAEANFVAELEEAIDVSIAGRSSLLRAIDAMKEALARR